MHTHMVLPWTLREGCVSVVQPIPHNLLSLPSNLPWELLTSPGPANYPRQLAQFS